MAARINTIWCEYEHSDSENQEKPTLRESFKWIFETLKSKIFNFEAKLIGIQNEPNGFYMKFNEPNICQEIIERLADSAKIKKENGTICRIKISTAGIGIRKIRISRLPFEVPNEKIKFEINKYGQVLSVEDEFWSQDLTPLACKYKTGTRIVRCSLEKHIPSFILINGTKGMVFYEGQPKTCSYCGDMNHLISNCVKLIDRKSKTSYSNIVQGPTLETAEDQLNPEHYIIEEPAQSSQLPISPPNLKRPLTSDTSSNEDNSDNSMTVDNSTIENPVPIQEDTPSSTPSRPVLKKNKPEFDFSETIDLLSTDIADHPTMYHLSADQLKQTLNELQYTDNMLTTISKHVDKAETFIEILHRIHKVIDNRGIKIRITKIITDLRKELQLYYLSSASAFSSQITEEESN